MELEYSGKTYHVSIRDTMAFPQDYAVMVTIIGEIKRIPKAVGIDIDTVWHMQRSDQIEEESI